MKKKAIMATFMAAALVAASLSGCGNSSKPAETTAKAETEALGGAQESTEQSAASETDTKDKKDLREVNVVLDWYPNAIHTFLYTAIERGYYEEEGLDVQIRFPSNANDALSMVAAGKAEIGMYYQQDLIQAVANQKAPIRSVGAIVQSPLNIILSLKDKNITSPKDMVGKTIGYGGTVLSESLVKCMMESVGADASDVKMVDVGFDLMSSMTTGNVDATIGCLVNHEVPQLEKEGFEVNYFFPDDYGVPKYYEGIFLASDDMIANNSDTLKGFLRACSKGFEDFKSNTDDVLQVLLDNQDEANFALDPDVEKKSCETLLPLMETEDAKFLSQTEQCWQENIDWMLENGLIDQDVDVADVMTVVE